MSSETISLITAIGAVATPLLLVVLSAVGWQVRRKIERRIELEDKLRSDRIEIYNEIIDPFIIILMSDAAWSSEKKQRKDKAQVATEKLLSLDYRRRSFQLSLMGSDAVVLAYNSLLQNFYDQSDDNGDPSNEKLVGMLELLGTFLLEIRRSMGNEATKLSSWDMIDWWMKDARRLRMGSLQQRSST